MTKSKQPEEKIEAPSPFHSPAEHLSQLTVPTAIPVDAFQENLAVATPVAADAAADLSNPDDVIVKPEPDDAADTPLLPLAYAIPPAGSLIQQQHTSSAQLRAANVKGTFSSEEEMADIAKAHRGIHDIQHIADEAVRAGNIAALGKKGKNDEGLAVDHRIHHLNIKCSLDEKQKKKDDDVRPYGTTHVNGNRGYEVKEYDTSEYKTTDYETTEYKSVYD
jgi:hypothetical protein